MTIYLPRLGRAWRQNYNPMRKHRYISPMLRVTSIQYANMLAVSEMDGRAADYGDGYDMLNNETETEGAAGGYGGGQSVFGD